MLRVLLPLWLAAAAPADPELELVRRSLLPSEQATVERDVGGLERLPRFRIDATLEMPAGSLKGNVQLQLADVPAAPLLLCVPADRGGAVSQRGQAVTLGRASWGGAPATLEHVSVGMYRVTPDPTARGRPAVLQVFFESTLPSLFTPQQPGARSRGYLGRYNNDVVLAGFYPEPCDDRPVPRATWTGAEPPWGMLGNFVVSITAPRGWSVAGTGVPVGEIPAADGAVRSVRAAAATRGFALVLVENAAPRSLSADGRTLTAIVEPDAAAAALESSRRALRFLDGLFGRYPWARYELVTLPVGLECQPWPGFALCGDGDARGLPVLGFHGLARSPGNTGAARDFALAHAASHQWLGGMVATDNVHAPALDEPLATFAAVRFAMQHPVSHCVEEETFFKLPFTVWTETGHADARADRPMSEYGSALEHVAILQGKGGLLVDALRKLMGDKPFRRALKSYVAARRFRPEQREGLVESLRQHFPAHARAAEALA
ncbi:MAG: M1 family aminopeptidase, partial [Myxococcales bacterium]